MEDQQQEPNVVIDFTTLNWANIAPRLWDNEKALATAQAVRAFLVGTDLRRAIQHAAFNKQTAIGNVLVWNDAGNFLDNQNPANVQLSPEFQAWLDSQTTEMGPNGWKNPPYHLDPQTGVMTNFQKALLSITE